MRPFRAIVVTLALLLAPLSAVAPGTAAAQEPVGSGDGAAGTPHAGEILQSGRSAPLATAPDSLGAASNSPAAVPSGFPVTGIDVSSHQGNVNWSAVTTAGAKFAYVKATEGSDYTNPYFGQQYGGAKAAGLYAGAYAFARPDANDPVAQADYLVANAQYANDGKTLPLMVDLEAPYAATGITNACWNLSPGQMVSWIRAFVDEVRAKTSRSMTIYTSTYWWNLCTSSNTSFGDQYLDIAYWSDNPPSTRPAGWSNWTFWQYADSGSLPGDQQVFNGNLDQLAAVATPPASAVVLSVSPESAGAVVGVRVPVGGAVGAGGPVSSVTVQAFVGSTAVGAPVVSGAGSADGDFFVTIPGLSAGTTYTFTATATGPGGVAASSDKSLPVIPGAGTGSGDFVPVGPIRSFDTRVSGPALVAGATRQVQVSGVAGVPASGVAAVAVAVSVISPTQPGFLTVWPSGSARPNATAVNFSAGQTKTNLTKVPVDGTGTISVFNHAGTADVTVDVVGYYIDSSAVFTHNVSFAATAPTRVLDTRETGSRVPAGGTVTATVRGGSTGVPASASVVEVTVEAVSPAASGFLTTWADGAPKPFVSNVLFGANQTIATSGIAPIGANGKIAIFANQATDVVVDVSGYYSAGATGRFHAITPTRLYDTRDSGLTMLGPAQSRYIPLAGVSVAGAVPVPNGASGVVFSATAVNNSAASYVTFWPADLPQPFAANLLPGAPNRLTDNLVVSGLGTHGTIPGAVGVYNNTGTTDIVIDVNGYYTNGPS